VLFGALYTTIPTIALVTIPVGYLIGGPAAAAVAFAMGIFSTLFYEFCHCVQHLNTTPKSAFMRQIKKYHLAHHFHNEHGNFGITNYLWDRLFGTFYPEPKLRPKSATVFNIGYTDEMAQRYPWVARLFVNGVQVERTALPPDAAAADLKHYRETLHNGRSYEIVEISDAHFLDILPETLVEPGHYFVMGDHRDASNDSRNPEFGAIALEAIEDRASVIWLIQLAPECAADAVDGQPITLRYSAMKRRRSPVCRKGAQPGGESDRAEADLRRGRRILQNFVRPDRSDAECQSCCGDLEDGAAGGCAQSDHAWVASWPGSSSQGMSSQSGVN
jgi:hypothetical protein